MSVRISLAVSFDHKRSQPTRVSLLSRVINVDINIDAIAVLFQDVCARLNRDLAYWLFVATAIWKHQEAPEPCRTHHVRAPEYCYRGMYVSVGPQHDPCWSLCGMILVHGSVEFN